MVSNNNVSSPSNKSSASEDSEVSTPQNTESPETRNSVTRSPQSKCPGKTILPPPKPDQVRDATPTGFLNACNKLDLEPNPFEQSFAHVTPLTEVNNQKPSLPPVASIASPSPGMPTASWVESLREGPLSPSMLAGPQNPVIFDIQPSGRTGNNTMSYGSFPDQASNPTAIFGGGGGGGGSIAPAVVSADTFRSTMYAQNISHQRNKIGSTGSTSNASNVASVATTQLGTAQIMPQQNLINITDATTSGPDIINIQNSTNAATSNSNVVSTNSLLLTTSINNRNSLGIGQQDSLHHRNGGASDNVVTKAESDDVRSYVNNSNSLYTSRSGRQSNGMSASVNVAASVSAPSSDDGFDEEFYDDGDYHHKTNSASSSPGSGPRNGRRKAEDNLPDQSSTKKLATPQQKAKNDLTEEEKRKNFLERNRQAALKCRQRKKQWLANLQAKVELLTTDNENLQNQTTQLREEILNLKTLLLAHKDCPINQANGVIPLDTMQAVGGIPQPMNRLNVPMGVGVGIVSNGVQNGNISNGVQGGPIQLTHVQHIPNQMNGQINGQLNGQPSSGMMRF